VYVFFVLLILLSAAVRASSLAMAAPPSSYSSPSLKNRISAHISYKINVPAEKAFGIYSDLSKHPQWCPQLRSVSVLDPINNPKISLWKLRVFKLNYSWEAEMIDYSLEKFTMAWRSLSGVKNDGIVKFSPDGSGSSCTCTLTQNIILPSLLCKLMPKARLERYIKEKVLLSSLQKFAAIVET